MSQGAVLKMLVTLPEDQSKRNKRLHRIRRVIRIAGSLGSKICVNLAHLKPEDQLAITSEVWDVLPDNVFLIRSF